MQPSATRRVQIAVPAREPAFVSGRQTAARILIVSGDPDLRAVLTRVLQQAGYLVDAAAHSGHALLLCRMESFDGLVAELCGPDISGPALADQVRRHCPEIATVYLGNPGTPEGVENLLVRPFTRDDLLDRLEAALVRERVPAR